MILVPFRLAAFEQELTLYCSGTTANGLTPGSAVQRRKKSTAIADPPAGRLDSNHAGAGHDDPAAPRLKFSSAVSPEFGSSCRFNSSPSGGTFRSSRSGAQPRSSRLERLSMQPTYPSARIGSTSGSVRGVEPFAALATPDRLAFVVPILISEFLDWPKCRI